MLVSWKWLSRYVDLTLSHDELVDRLSLSGLNHEGSETIDGDVVIDLEVTSNRGDCLGHIGVAREIAALTDQKLKIPTVEFQEAGDSVDKTLSVDNQMTDACPRYTARVIRGVKVGESPQWLQESLKAVGIGVVNNVVDITNYVMMECGQPLHAFDFAKVGGKQIVVRSGKDKEQLEAIDHRNYDVNESTCVIADQSEALAIGGVMGGASSEVNEGTTDIILEAADFVPLSVRRTARRLKLHSPSSFRFERRVDPKGIDWASRRACQLITEIAGGKVAPGVIDTASDIPERESILLRPKRVTALLGMEIETAELDRILKLLGCEVSAFADGLQCVPPTWRHDLTREVDLIEEVARIHGYDKIPEDAPIPVAPSSKRRFDTAMERIRGVLTAAGISEAMTPSVVTEKLDQMLSPWTDRPALQTRTSMLEGARTLRRSLIPSLLQSRAANWASASLLADLFEIAHVYLPAPSDSDDALLPDETYHVGLIGGEDFFAMKGIIETLCDRLGIVLELGVNPVSRDGFAKGGAVELLLRDHAGKESIVLGFLGFVDDKLVKQFKLTGRVVAAELSAGVLVDQSRLVPQQQAVSAFPSIQRDLNLVLPESVRWNDLAALVQKAAQERLADLTYRETYRNEKVDGPDKKRVLFSMELQSQTETLSGSDADAIINELVASCEKQLDAVLLR
ncbi:phenylalanine--tRNA ligase subunit beta [Rhodopirellula sp. JC740]|uniref:Phenylalanine--tRNA ligase beta subunit n=1 Tax=Rhodopirellula halodulae TaxID=2894198 RepID=A0ABS8NCD6_9BACT|nr:phenylalanine--tRNA ligase subunit beta [Rhodopirellula sp. JC740]MCC9641210.1 phenylalanine--tRNA ligase subunit beta [Rhodopirellula sp. JC740]